MKRIVIALIAVSLTGCLLGVANAQDATDRPDGPTVKETTAFNVELVNKIKKSCVYIWSMESVPGRMVALTATGIGSGVIFMADEENNAAYALTNHHVAGTNVAMQVEFWDRSTYFAELVATAPGIDVAVIRIRNIKRDAYEPCVLGNADAIQIGELCLAVGAPGDRANLATERSDQMINFGLHQTTTMSVVSGRETHPWSAISAWSGWRVRMGRSVMTNIPWRFITQAAINGGNSGGPLFNSRGECIGLNHAHLNVSSQIGTNINYTIPIKFAKDFAFQILNNEKYEIPWFGMDMFFPSNMSDPQSVFQFREQHFDEELLIILSVRDDSPAAEAEVVSKNTRDKAEGLRVGDVIIEFDGRVFDNSYDLRLYVFNMQIGDTVPLTVKRGRNKVDLEMTVGAKRTWDSEFSI